MTYLEMYNLAVEKADSMSCPDCESYSSLEYVDDEVLVCKICQFSVDAEDLQQEWEDFLQNEYDITDDFESGSIYPEDDYDDDENDESLSVYDAALIWISNGRDEDYMFGYTEEELRNAL